MPRHLIASVKSLDRDVKQALEGRSPSRLSDGDGLYLKLSWHGKSHLWNWDYTRPNGLRNTLSFGPYPKVTLAAARKHAAEAGELLANGTDPSDARKASRAARKQMRVERRREVQGLPRLGSFEAVAREWWSNRHSQQCTPGHSATTLKRLEQYVFPLLGAMQCNDITAPRLLECLRRLEVRGTLETAHRVKNACGQVFRYGIATGACERNPASDLRDALRPVSTRHLGAIVKPSEVGALLRAIDGYAGMPVVRCAMTFAALAFQRPGEIRMAKWAEIDLDASMWTIPSERMKGTKAKKATGMPHLVPLSRQAVTLLRELRVLTGGSDFLFPSDRSNDRPISDGTVNAAMRRMGYTSEEMTGHGFRAMARTILAEQLGVSESIIEQQLAHRVPDALGRAYNRTEWLPQRRDMMQQWADYLDGLKRGNEVVHLRSIA